MYCEAVMMNGELARKKANQRVCDGLMDDVVKKMKIRVKKK